MTERLFDVTSLGEDGDGIATDAAARTVHIEGALPGERVLASAGPRRATLDAVLWPSPDRVAPVCSLSGPCGGCTLQHQDRTASLAWKSERVAEALRRAGHERVSMLPPVATALGTRRRLGLGIARRSDGTVQLGLRRRDSDEIVDMTECHVLRPELFALLAPLRDRLRRLPCVGRRAELLINLLDTGPDLLLRTDRVPGAEDRALLASFADRHGLCRVAWQRRHDRRCVHETLVQLAPARLHFASRAVEPPPGAFLQATTDGERAITASVLNGLPELRPQSRLLELYAGCGTLTMALASRARVRAFEGDRAAAAALGRAARGLAVEVVCRDLDRDPLTAPEIGRPDAIVLDPPYEGASRQIAQLASAASGTIILASCNPAALGRDALVLGKAGFALDHAIAIDQFLFSARVEAVAVFRRENSRRSRNGPSRSGCGTRTRR